MKDKRLVQRFQRGNSSENERDDISLGVKLQDTNMMACI